MNIHLHTIFEAYPDDQSGSAGIANGPLNEGAVLLLGHVLNSLFIPLFGRFMFVILD